MKVGFTAKEAYSMFRSLRKEVFGIFDYNHSISFGTRDGASLLFQSGEIAFTQFGADPDATYVQTLQDHASGIRFNSVFLPLMFEDELLITLLHELTHVTAGFDAGHGPAWQHHAEVVGALPNPVLTIRNWDLLPGRHRPPALEVERSGGPSLARI